MTEIKIEKEQKLITCILHKGDAKEIVNALNHEKSVTTDNVASGRGSGMVEQLRYGDVEVDILTVVIGEDRADEIFQFIYEKAGIGEFFRGIMYQGRLNTATSFTLPEIPEEESGLTPKK